MIHIVRLQYPHRTGRAVASISMMLAVVALALAGQTSRALAGPSYSFSTEVVPYQDLEGATTADIGPGDEPLHTLDFGQEEFFFFKKPYQLTGGQVLEIAGQGFVRFWTETSVVVIDGYFMNFSKRDETSTISCLIAGEPGDRILKVQWKNVGFPHGLPTDYINFQIWLHQKSGIIELRIGPNQVQGPDAYKENGPWLGAFTSPKTFTEMTEKCWITGDPANPILDTKKVMQFKRLTGTPAPGTMYRLTPTAEASVLPRSGDTRELRLLPNPVADIVTFDLGDALATDATIRVIDMGGSIVAERRLKEDERTIDVAALPGGAYVVEITRGNERYVGKITKQ